MNILCILNELALDAKRKRKVSVVTKYINDDVFRRVLYLALNPYVVFHIKKIPEYTTQETPQHELSWALAELEQLSSRVLTGNAGVEHLRGVLSSISADDAVVIRRVIGKDLRCGTGDTVVNEVMPGLIPTYPCLLARPYSIKNCGNIAFDAYSQLKTDGLRANIIVDTGIVQIYGRSGLEIPIPEVLDDDFLYLGSCYQTPMLFDGELYVVDEAGNVLSRRVGNGIINKAGKGTLSAEEASRIRVHIWDAFTVDEFNARKSNDNYKIRFTALTNAIGNDSTRRYSLIPSRVVHSLDEAVEHFNEMLALGMEGTILKDYRGIWEDARSKYLVKFKSEKEADLEIIGYVPGKGQYEGMVGSIIAASSDRKVEVAFSGFTVEERTEITAKQDELLGTIVAVKYNERISSKSKGREQVDSLFLPRLAEFRTDKTTAESSATIK